ncbi:hypothetical protein CROQUDRAFT_714111 [Cronartium quercuum f. sp. fusiforme G11]|uniref:ABC transporter domain-containing protein n=1 Tax=Cronartium quercuum f. sp. fusiforme G11 TaxID=708437 RepID=A0A9P6TFV1_9BASI|nr:hypothetical protein CROQUDRAFT_714111 [Cronartium quercuum f. sp. fusiforme G11]
MSEKQEGEQHKPTPLNSSVPTSLHEDGDLDIEAAERTFAELRHQLTVVSATHLSESGNADLEKLGEAGAFDLLSYLRDRAAIRDKHHYHHKEMGVIFEKLGVVGAGGIKLLIRTFPKALMGLFLYPVFFVVMRMPRFRPPPKRILHSFSGCVKPGELCLVLGRPNSGCSTFLKVIANQRFGYQKIEGKVTYGRLIPEEISKRYKGEVCYNPEDDVHHATLTVGQTMNFALSLLTPGKLLPEQTRKDFRREVSDTLLKMLGILHTKNTLVGNEHVRGVSGGERKRVSIAEMMATRACVMSWDNSTRGLDASTALQYAKSLRIVSNIFKVVSFVTLYQAGEGIYEQFDKICLIDQGRQVYFGPAKEARQYMIDLGFKDLPRQTTADFLTGCTDQNERQFQDGIDISKVPKTPEELEEAYLNSDVYRRMEQETEEYRQVVEKDFHGEKEFKLAVKDSKRRYVGKNSPHRVNFFGQLKPLILREFQLKLQDRKGLIFSWCTSTFLAIVIGSVFINLPQTSAGAFTRGGVLFISLLFNVFLAFAELPKQMLGRPILWRQAGFCFYRPGAMAIASALAEIPFSMIKILVFCGIIYLMAHLVRTGGAFWTLYVIVFVSYFALSCFFRLLGAISFNFDIAARIASLLMIAMVLYSGYIIPEPAMRRWLVWLYYINPVNWAFAALMANEFQHLSLACVGSSIVPSGPGFPEGLGPNQACTLLGARAGNPNVLGEDYIQASYKYSKKYIWRNFGFELGYIALFLTLLFIAVEKLSMGFGRPGIYVFAKENEERKRLNERLQERKQDFRTGKAQQDLSGLIKTRKPFTWEGLTYDVAVPGGQRRLLNEIYGYVKPGTLTALMGSSGAGKTTLLDVLANRKTTGVIGGEVCVAGRARGQDFQRMTSYCEQQDVHEWTATVREALRFSAYLRQSAEITKEEKDNYVEEVIQLLEMEDIADGDSPFFEPSFIMARGIHTRELSSKSYASEIFAISQFLSEIPYSILCSMCYFFLWYYLPGFPHESERSGYAFLFVFLVELYSISLGQAIASLSPSVFIASQINPPLIVSLNLFSGVTVPRPNIPSFWRGWMYNLNPSSRLIAGLLVNAIHDLPIVCEPAEFSVFQPPANQTCDQWAGQYAKQNRGHLENPQSTSDCRYCHYTVGDQFYDALGFSYDYKWRDLGIYIAYIVFNIFVTVIACKFLTLRYAKQILYMI